MSCIRGFGLFSIFRSEREVGIFFLFTLNKIVELIALYLALETFCATRSYYSELVKLSACANSTDHCRNIVPI